MPFPDPHLSDYDLKVFRCLNGEDPPGLQAGTAINITVAYLKNLGYAQGLYEISPKGKAYHDFALVEGDHRRKCNFCGARDA